MSSQGDTPAFHFATSSVTQTQTKPLKSSAQGTLPQLDPLPPLPIDFVEEQHKYIHRPTQQVMAFSITQILGSQKTERQMAQINATKFGPMDQPELGWAYRGTKLHQYAESPLLGSLTIGDVEPWALPYIEPLVANPFFENFNVLGTELRVCDLERSIGVSMDAILQSKKTGRVLLMDWKSQSSPNAKPYDVSMQLAGYMGLLQQHHRIEIHAFAAGWLRPGKFQMEILKRTPDEAYLDYQAARDAFLAQHVPF